MNNESYDFEDRKYVNPTLSRDEQLSFVDRLRNVQQNDVEKIARDTHNLGTDVPSTEGGLSGSERLWNAQYVTPKVNSMVSGLEAAAQASALTNVLSNYSAQMEQRYNEAYRAAEKRKDAQDNDNDSGSSDKKKGAEGDDDVNYEKSDDESDGKSVSKVEPNYSPITGTWEYTRAGTVPSKIYVEYDDYGRPKRVVDGAYGNKTYVGDDAVAYWNKIKNLNYSSSKKVE